MKDRILFFLFLTVTGFLCGYFILSFDLQASTTGDLLVKLGKSLIYSMGALSLIFLILLFTPQALPAWKKFAIWFVPLAALLFVLYPNPGSGDLFSPYPEQIYQWVSVLYVIVSSSIIAWSAVTNKKTP